MKHSVPHDLSIDQAKEVAHKALEAYKTRFAEYNPTLTWRDNTHADIQFSAKGMTLNGTVEIEPKAISFDLDVPFIFRLFKGKAIEVLDREVNHWLAQTKT